MKNIPFFTAQYGVASLTLEDVPYTGKAYITLQSCDDPEKLLCECVGFCKAVGAEVIYACNHGFLEAYPLHTRVLEMKADKATIPYSAAELRPVTEETIDSFAQLYNKKMQGVKTARYLTQQQARELILEQSAYFVYESDALIGLGVAAGEELRAVAALQKGAGRSTVSALCKSLPSDTVRLEVAEENRKVIALYSALGFRETAVLNSWYKIL